MLFCSFNGVPAEERLHWRSFLVKLGADNLKGIKNEELLVACHKYVIFFLSTVKNLLSNILKKIYFPSKLVLIFLWKIQHWIATEIILRLSFVCIHTWDFVTCWWLKSLNLSRVVIHWILWCPFLNKIVLIPWMWLDKFVPFWHPVTTESHFYCMGLLHFCINQFGWCCSSSDQSILFTPCLGM